VADVRDAGRGVAGNVAPLSSTERSRRHRARKKERAGSGVSGDGAWSPAFRGQRPPFAPGNQFAVVSGYTSPARILPLAGQVRERLLDSSDCPPWLSDESYQPLLDAWAFATGQAMLLRQYVSDHPLEQAMTETSAAEESERSSGGDTKRVSQARRTMAANDALHRCEQRVLHLSVQLGLTPLARGKVKAAAPRFDMALVMAEITEEDAGTAG
jgi:hypothetical protein